MALQWQPEGTLGLGRALDQGQVLRQMTTVARRFAWRLSKRPLQRGLGVLRRGLEHALCPLGIFQG